jgi:hypothetical protein
MHFQALSCNGRLPELLKISNLRLSRGTHKATGVHARLLL